MSVLVSKLWGLLSDSYKSELSEKSTEYLKSSLGEVFAKYIYNKDLTHANFLKNIDEDFEFKRIDKVVLLENMCQIFSDEKDLDTVIELRKEKIKFLKILEDKNISQEYFLLAVTFFETKKYKKSLKNIDYAINAFDLKKLNVKLLTLLIDCMHMKVQLKIILHAENNEIENDLTKFYKLVEDSKQYIDLKSYEKYLVKFYVLELSHLLNKSEYKAAISSGEKALSLIETNTLELKAILKYYLYEKLGYAYLFSKDYKNTIKVSKKALVLIKENKNLPAFSILVVLVESYIAQHEYDMALEYAHEANSYVNNSVEKLKYTYEMLARLYTKKKEVQKAQEYTEKLKYLEVESS